MKVFLFLILWLQVCWSLRHGNENVIERPCSLHNINCIRRYFAANSLCWPTHGPAPDPYRLKILPKFIPHANITFTLNDIEINGFNDWKINEFYINKKTDKLVLEVEFKSLVVYSDATVVKYFSKGKEPLKISDWTIIDYRGVSLTMTVPHIRNLDLSKAEVFAYLSDAAPQYELGPKFYESRDHEHHEHIERPCSLCDVNCIRRYFVANSKCSPTHGPVPDPYEIKTLPLYIPHTNVTFTLNDNEINGFNDWKINEFYINKKTDNLVLEVEFKSLFFYSDRGVITYYRKGKEPIVVADYANIDYNCLSLTMTVPHIKNIDLSKAMVFAYISDAGPRNELGPAFKESKEPLVREANRQLVENFGVTLREVFVTQAPVFMAVFVQSTICDFKLNSVTI